MSEPPNPRNWKDVPDWFIWGCLVLACAFEIIGGAVIGDWGRAFAALVVAVALMAAGLHWKKVNPYWAVPAAITLIIVIALSPFVEHGRWPFSPVVPKADYDALVAKLAASQQLNTELASRPTREDYNRAMMLWQGSQDALSKLWAATSACRAGDAGKGGNAPGGAAGGGGGTNGGTGGEGGTYSCAPPPPPAPPEFTAH